MVAVLRGAVLRAEPDPHDDSAQAHGQRWRGQLPVHGVRHLPHHGPHCQLVCAAHCPGEGLSGECWSDSLIIMVLVVLFYILE